MVVGGWPVGPLVEEIEGAGGRLVCGSPRARGDPQAHHRNGQSPDQVPFRMKLAPATSRSKRRPQTKITKTHIELSLRERKEPQRVLTTIVVWRWIANKDLGILEWTLSLDIGIFLHSTACGIFTFVHFLVFERFRKPFRGFWREEKWITCCNNTRITSAQRNSNLYVYIQKNLFKIYNSYNHIKY